MYKQKLELKMLTHHFPDKLEITKRAVISSLLRIAADHLNEINI